MLDLRFFRNPQFAAATTAITFVFFVMFGMIFVITQYLQLVLGYSPLEAGVRMLPWAAVYMVSATRSARLVERFGQRRVGQRRAWSSSPPASRCCRAAVSHTNYPSSRCRSW